MKEMFIKFRAIKLPSIEFKLDLWVHTELCEIVDREIEKEGEKEIREKEREGGKSYRSTT